MHSLLEKSGWSVVVAVAVVVVVVTQTALGLRPTVFFSVSIFPSFQLSLFPSVLVFLSQVSYLSHNRLFLDLYVLFYFFSCT